MDKSMSYWAQVKQHLLSAADQERPDLIKLPLGEMNLASCANILREDWGLVAASNRGIPRGANGDYLPLFTLPCIEFIRQFDLQEKDIFEWGAGASTLYWMSRAKNIICIENNRAWYNDLKTKVGKNVDLVLDEGSGFALQIQKTNKLFDIVVIDGYGFRYDCAQLAVNHLQQGGMIILDNAEWHPQSAALLKRSGLIQIDFSGFKLTESHVSVTSLFLKRDFNFKTIEARQPSYPLGAKKLISAWDQEGAEK